MGIWVDTDFGFDDLWALLLLRYLGCCIDGVSLVAGNSPLQQVTRNAQSSILAFDFSWPVYSGASKPLQRTAETARRVLGSTGMQTRGMSLPYEATATVQQLPTSAVDALGQWLNQGTGPHHILALGPLTNLAMLQQLYPDAADSISQITWLGGSRARGNHTEFAEFNALADPEALASVTAMPCPFKMIELELCRRVVFSEADIPKMTGKNQKLLTDLLGGYLDIALQRQRNSMAVYDPIAALAVADQGSIVFDTASLDVHTEPDARYGQTVITKRASHQFEVAVDIDRDASLQLCMAALVDA